ncbi:MAG TPA: cyclic nucleotide-binding domain-containing protein [Candidatus Dormibacteraeota bacterium]|nr:cyclic nucleotide-binding domain-containing protein [Candidatus Dormibacteraeota bacterium]
MELKAEGLFAGLPPDELKKLAREMREVRHPAGAEMIIRGKEGVGFMVILEGQAEVTTSDGRHRTLGPGDYFGEMALLDHQGRSADITAKTDLVVAAVTEWGFKTFLAENPEIAYRLLQTLSRRLREAEEAQKSRG